MTTDRELLELAAKAAGFELIWDGVKPPYIQTDIGWLMWNALLSDGDALRLAVKLNIDVMVQFDRIDAFAEGGTATEYIYEKPTPTDPYAATRRAIVRAAAEIGKI